jgi:alkylation response protein AidB-like acyl-CoA dehydrogenase
MFEEPPYVTAPIAALRREAAQFAEHRVRPAIAVLETGAVDRDLIGQIARHGWLALTIPAQYGGASEEYGGGHLAKTIVLEELARANAGVGAAAQASILGIAKILHFGNDEQKRRWLPAVATGNVLPTIAVTDPAAGSAVLSMGGSAERRGGDWLINASKAYIGNAAVGHVHGVVVPTGGRQAKQSRFRSLSAFLIEADRPGIRLLPKENFGLKGFSFDAMEFIDCRVPAEALLGEVGDGLAVAYSSSLLYGRLNLAAVSLGLHRAIVEAAVEFSLGRELGGAPLTRIDIVKAGLGQMASRLMTARTVVYDAAHLLDLGMPCDAELINAKLISAEGAVAAASAAMTILAGRALQDRHPVARFLADAYTLLPPAGTPEIQELRLAEALTGQNTHEQWSVRFANPVPARSLAAVS